MAGPSDVMERLQRLLKNDRRYRREAYAFVHEALGFAQKVLKLGTSSPPATERPGEPAAAQRHLTGQQLCEAIRIYANDQFGYLAKVVLKSWGIRTTSDFGEIVYSLIEIGFLNKSKSDRREDFDNVYDFDEVFGRSFEIGNSTPEEEEE